VPKLDDSTEVANEFVLDEVKKQMPNKDMFEHNRKCFLTILVHFV
jgi:hypothetical protein